MTMDAQTGISAALQKRLFAEDAAPYAPGESGEPVSTAQRILDYFASPSSLLGLSLPNGVLWGVGFILVCVIVVLLVRLLSPGSASAGKASPGSAVTPGSAPGRLARGEMSSPWTTTARPASTASRSTTTCASAGRRTSSRST